MIYAASATRKLYLRWVKKQKQSLSFYELLKFYTESLVQAKRVEEDFWHQGTEKVCKLHIFEEFISFFL